jgi:hypothetical protein
VGVALSVWIHGAWYLWAIPIGAFVLAAQWRTAMYLVSCTAAGVLIGATFTGRPFTFLKQAVDIARLIETEHVHAYQLVGEFRPGDGNFTTLALLAVVWIACQQAGAMPPRKSSPIVWQIIICWILSFHADRFRADWGVPAVLLWLALCFEQLATRYLPAGNWQRLTVAGLMALGLYTHVTNDTDQRYTFSHSEQYLDAKDPRFKDCFPGPGGIFYTANGDFFFQAFYRNPTGDWRYLLGMEPTLLPPEDLKTFRRIQLTDHSPRAYEPWLKKLRPIDRLVVFTQQQPPIPQLEWLYAGGTCWVGRVQPAN